MMTPRRLFFRLSFSAALALGSAPMGFASAGSSSSVIANAPVKNFRLPSFNAQGHRTHLLRGSEARYISTTQIDVVNLHYSQFRGDGSTDTANILLAPSASVFLQERARYIVRGGESMRLINDDFEATGEQWTYDHEAQKLTLGRNVRVVFHQPLQDILK
jgi:hypothetical protein